MGPELIKLLPPTLTELRGVDASALALLPPSLTLIEVRTLTKYWPSDLIKIPGEKITTMLIKGLESHQVALSLPNSLKRLFVLTSADFTVIEPCMVKLTGEIVADLPRGLLELSVNVVPTLGQAVGPSAIFSSPSPEEFLRFLPPRLTRLSIMTQTSSKDDCPSIKWNGQASSYLPRCLNYLQFRMNCIIGEGWFANLPPVLRYLSCDISGFIDIPEIRDIAAAGIELQQLRLGFFRKLSDQELSDLADSLFDVPYGLESLSILFWNQKCPIGPKHLESFKSKRIKKHDIPH
jgi:hypothetical protein